MKSKNVGFSELNFLFREASQIRSMVFFLLG